MDRKSPGGAAAPEFVHRFEPAPDPSQARTLLLLHGTGGDENDLVPLGRDLAPDANLLSPRGQVLENGMPRFFRRLAQGVLDVPDLKARAQNLADFVEVSSKRYHFGLDKTTALGYSNGANIASSLLLQRPETLRGAILARAMVPYQPERVPDLSGKRILLLAGRHDPYTRSPISEDLAAIFERGGADVQLHWTEAGHELTTQDVQAARQWLQEDGA